MDIKAISSNFERYPAYKDSGVEWIGDIPEGWEVRRIKYLYKIGRGRVIAQTELDEFGKFPVYSSQTKENGILGFINTYDFDCEQITWTTDGANAGTIFIRTGKHNCTNVCGTLQSIKSDLNNQYSKYSLEVSSPNYKRPDTNGAKIMNNEMANIYIVQPPVLEQTAIAEFLDNKTEQIERSIAQKEALISLLKERKQIIIQDLVTGKMVWSDKQQAFVKFSDSDIESKDSGVEWIGGIPKHWEVKRLKYILKEPLKYGANEVGIKYEQNLPRYIRITDFSSEGNLNEEKKLSLPYKKAKEYLLENGDILFARSGATVGKSYQFRKSISSEKNYCFAGYLIKASPNEALVLSDFLSFYTFSRSYENWKRLIFNKATIENIGADKYSQLQIPCPPIIEQIKIISHIESQSSKIDQVITLQQHQIDRLKEFKASLIDSAVTGKIKVS